MLEYALSWAAVAPEAGAGVSAIGTSCEPADAAGVGVAGVAAVAAVEVDVCAAGVAGAGAAGAVVGAAAGAGVAGAALGFETITTRKSFSLIFREATVAASWRILPTRVNKRLEAGRR